MLKHNLGAEETVQQLKAFTALGEDLGLAFKTQMVAQNHP